jgi:large subunit ribosomal protein L22
MITRAVLRYVRISPRKVRVVIPLVKGKNPEEAVAVLFSVKKKASAYLIDLLRSAIANAKRIQGVDAGSLYISKLIADGGPQMKRFRAASMGRAGMIRKRTSHITVELDAVKPGAEQRKTHDAAHESVKHDKAKLVRPKAQQGPARKHKAAVAHKPHTHTVKKGKE